MLTIHLSSPTSIPANRYGSSIYFISGLTRQYYNDTCLTLYAISCYSCLDSYIQISLTQVHLSPYLSKVLGFFLSLSMQAIMGLTKAYHRPNYRPIGHSTLQTPWMAQGIIGLPASHLMAFMYDNIQIISTGLYGASKFLKWYLYQPLLYPTLYPSIYLYLMPTTMPTFQTPKTYLQIFHTKLLKIILQKFLENFSINVLQIQK